MALKLNADSSPTDTALELERCDFNIGRNNSNHHTELFGEDRLIVRRGQRFDLTLHRKPDSGKFALDDNSFSLIAKTGRPPPLACKIVAISLNCPSLLLVLASKRFSAS